MDGFMIEFYDFYPVPFPGGLTVHLLVLDEEKNFMK